MRTKGNIVLGLSSLLAVGALPPPAFGFAVGHHGGIILNCTAPVFFEESPPKDAKVAAFDRFSFTASDDTDPETLKVWVNAQPVEIAVTPQLSGRLTVSGKLAQPLTQGKAWIKATGVSHDGCDQLHTWNVYIAP